MATIKPNDNAPSEAATYEFASQEPFVLSPGESLDTDDAALVKAVLEHPWLDVEGTVTEPEVDEPEADVAAEPLAESNFNSSGFFAAGDDA